MAHAYRTKTTLGSIAAVVALIVAPFMAISPAHADGGPPAGAAIPESQYSIASFDSQSPPYPAPPSLDGTAKGAIDGDVNTEWTSLGTALPHWIAVDLGATHTVSGIQYSVKNQSNGPIKAYKVFATNDATVADSTTGDWGQPVATGVFTQPTSNAQVQSVSFKKPVTARFIKLEADSTINGANYAAISEIRAFTTDDIAPAGAAIPENQYSIAGFDSQSPAYPAPPSLDGTAKGAIDGDVNTEWTSLGTALPHWLAVDLGATYNVTGIQYSVKNQSNGPIKDYKVFATNDVSVAHSTTGDWGQPVATGVFSQPTSNAQVQSVSFKKPVTARFIKLEADSTINGANYAAISEIRAFTTGPAVPPPPYGVTVGALGPWSNPDDTSASPFIDKNGKFYYESAHSLYGATASRTWSFNTGTNMDNATPDASTNQAANPADPADKNSDTTKRCNNSPTGLSATYAPAGSGYSQRNFCDLTQMWVDPDTGNWYGLVHNEFTPQPFGDGLHYDAIDYAVSTDQGKTWTIKAHVITSPYSTIRGDATAFPGETYYYGDGDPRLYVDKASGYFYMYYGSRVVDKKGSWKAFYEHVARAPIADKMASGSWSKWYDGSWSQPGLGGKESNMVPVSSTNTTGYTPPAKEYNPKNLGTASQQIAAGQMPPTSPLFVMDITYDAYLGLYIGEPQNPDQSGNAPQQYYATKSLATQKWTLLGDTGSYTTASWYRWFLDSANATSSNIVGKSFRSYCSFGCSNGSASEYANVTIDQNASAPAPVIDTTKNYMISSGLGRALAQVGKSTVTKTISSSSHNPSSAWTFTANGDGSYNITNAKSGGALGVSNTTSGRAWGAALTVTPIASPGQTAQQWFVIPGVTSTGTAMGDYSLVNRYSGLVISLSRDGSQQAVTTPFRSWTDTSKRTVGKGETAAAQTLSLRPVDSAVPTRRQSTLHPALRPEGSSRSPSAGSSQTQR